IRDNVMSLERDIQRDEQRGELIRLRVLELARNEARLVSEIDELAMTMDCLSTARQGMCADLEEILSEITRNTEHIEAREKERVRLCEVIRDKETVLRIAQKELLDLRARAGDMRHSMETLLKEEDAQRIREARIKCEKDEIEKSLHALEHVLAGLNDQLLLSYSRLADSKGRFSSNCDMLARIEAAKASVEEALSAVKEKTALSESRLSTLQEMDKNLEGLSQGARSIMRLKHEGAVIGLVADVIETTPGYEKAVEAVLGERLQYVMVQSQAEGIEAIEYLKSHSAGRTSFVPIKDVRLTQTNEQGKAGELISEVRVRQGYEAIVGYLLSDTFVVPDLMSAKKLWEQNGRPAPRGAGTPKTFVTMDGCLIDPHGIMTGGSTNGHDRGILQKRREIADLKSAVHELNDKRQALDKELSGLVNEGMGIKTDIDFLNESIRSAELEGVGRSAELKGCQSRQKSLLEQSNNLTNELAEIEKVASEVSSRKIKLANERAGIDEVLRQKEQSLFLLEQGIKTLGSEKDTAASLIADERVMLASLKERHESIKTAIVEKERLGLDVQRKKETKTIEVEDGRKEIRDSSLQLEGLTDKTAGLLLKRDALKRDELSSEESLREITSECSRSEAGLKGKNTDIGALRDKRAGLFLKTKEMEMSLALLKDRMIERYGVAIDDLDMALDETLDIPSMEFRADELKQGIASLGEVSLSALTEYAELEERHKFLLTQQADINTAVEGLHSAITRINKTIRERFKNTFDEIDAKFRETFSKLFSGGKAQLRLSDEEDILETGIEIVAQPAGKRLQNITLLSGGEKALTATALIFAIFLIKPSPFCLLDEVDAPLDDANIERFNSFVREISEKSQFVLITHNKRTMELADRLFGITMEEPGVSKVVQIEL
ncbi:MAG: chromosome segregation protein SMC, partial [Deltaproteobacteria bacterium]|nr:chromosome segregation protein SMC [Deltaproteobacteria bacterium]